jgi:hypothetical protein
MCKITYKYTALRHIRDTSRQVPRQIDIRLGVIRAMAGWRLVPE